MLDIYPIDSRSFEKFYPHIDGKQFSRQYKEHLSDYSSWSEREHAKDWLLFPDNLGERLSIDETSLSDGELYTIVTNKAAKGKKGALVAIVQGTQSEQVIKILEGIPLSKRNLVKEITLDMAETMRKTVRKCFPSAVRVIDRFHVQKLACDALQQMRVEHRWEAIDEDTKSRQKAKDEGRKYVPEILENGDTKKQLLARSRYLLFKSSNRWSASQKQRAKMLFLLYPDLEKAYGLTQSLRMIYSKNTIKDAARLSLARWYNEVEKADFKAFNIIAATVKDHYQEILNFFNNRSTNASAEAFNAKIKAFRAVLRGVVDVPFFFIQISTDLCVAPQLLPLSHYMFRT